MRGYFGCPPDDMATIDHLRSRLHPDREKHTDEPTTVLACWKCNNQRGTAEVKGLSAAERIERSQRGHRKKENGNDAKA